MEKTSDFLKSHKMLVFGVADVAAIALGVLFAFWGRFDGMVPAEYAPWILYYIGILAVLNIFFIWRMGLYAFTWSYVGIAELFRLVKAVTYANLIFAAVALILWNRIPLFAAFPRSVLFINYACDLLFIGAIRVAKRLFLEVTYRRSVQHAEATLIVGAGDEGEQIIRGLAKDARYNPIGIVDERPLKHKTFVHGIPVLGSINEIPRLVERHRGEHNIKHIIIALTAADAQSIRHAVKLGRESGITSIKIVPTTHELLSGKRMTDLREVQIEDLLGRAPAKLDTKEISAFVKNKTVLVTGAAGSIGSELVRQCLAFEPKKLLILDFNESGIFDLDKELSMSSSHLHARILPIIADITDREKIERIMKAEKPDVIFHAAAYKHVPLMEDYPEEAVRVNVFGTKTLAEAAIAAEVPKFVLISTDKAINPLSVMGKAKRAAELVLKALNEEKKTKFVAVRFGNVIGSRGSVVPLFQEQIKRRSPITVTHPDMKRYFMTIPEAALLVMEAGSVGKGGEVFMLDMGQPVKIADLAKEMIRLAGLEPDIDVPVIFTGIRPGEKLFEEIISEEERRVNQTQWDKIFVTRSEKPADVRALKERAESLLSSLHGDKEGVKRSLDAFIKE